MRGPQGLPEGGLGGELDHLLETVGMEVTAGAVLLAEEARLLAAVSASAHGESSLSESILFTSVSSQGFPSIYGVGLLVYLGQ